MWQYLVRRTYRLKSGETVLLHAAVDRDGAVAQDRGPGVDRDIVLERRAISPDTAVSAVVDWTTLSHSNVTDCTRVFLQTPSGYPWSAG